MKFEEFDSRGRTLKYFIKGDINCIFGFCLFCALFFFSIAYVFTSDLSIAICVSASSFMGFPIGLLLIFVIRIIDIKSMSK